MMQASVFLLLGGFLSIVFLVGLLNAKRNRNSHRHDPRQLDLPMEQPGKEEREMASAHR